MSRGRPPKFGKKRVERYEIMMTPEQKAAIMAAGTADVWLARMIQIANRENGGHVFQYTGGAQSYQVDDKGVGDAEKEG